MPAARQMINVGKAQRSEVPGDGKHAQQETGVPNAVDDERLVSRGTGGMAMEVEADQEIRAEADALPANEHYGVVVRQNQRQHGEHEQVQISEKAVVTAFVRHVAGGVDVNQHPDAGDEKQPDGGKRVEQESGIGVE